MIWAWQQADGQKEDRSEFIPLSFAQQRLWLLAQLDTESTPYHIPLAMRLSGDLDHAALRAALDRILLRHEALRTAFLVQDGEVFQKIGTAPEKFLLVQHDLRASNELDSEVDRRIREEANARFDLEKGPLIRGILLLAACFIKRVRQQGWRLDVNSLFGPFPLRSRQLTSEQGFECK